MRDLLTKKRIRVDYEYLIKVLGLFGEFQEYYVNHGTAISKRRLQLCFLRNKKVDIPTLYYFCKWNHVFDYCDLVVKSDNRVGEFYGM